MAYKFMLYLVLAFLVLSFSSCSKGSDTSKKEDSVSISSQNTEVKETASDESSTADIKSNQNEGEKNKDQKDDEVKPETTKTPTVAPSSVKSSTEASSDKINMLEVYTLALDALISADTGLNGGMKYIAVDMNKLKGIGEEDRKKITEYLEKYNVKVLDESFESLQKKGMVIKNTMLEGILLRVDDVKEISEKEITVECSKLRSALGAITMKYTLSKNDSGLRIIKSDRLSVS